MSYAGIVLAAGASTRMGSTKMLLPLAGEALVHRAARTCLAADLEPVVVVVGHDAVRVTAAVADLPVRTATNPDHRGPTSTSLQAGLAALDEDVAGALVVLGDMVCVTAAMLRELVATARATGAPGVLSRYGEVVAPPHLFDRRLLPEVLAWSGPEAGRGVLRRHRPATRIQDWPPEALLDVDRPGDLERARALLES